MARPKPLWSFKSHPREVVVDFIERYSDVFFSYPEVGYSDVMDASPKGYVLDHNRVKIGQGPEVFDAGCDALRLWKMFPAPWTQIQSITPGLREGKVVAMEAHAFGLYWLSACRILYMFDEDRPLRRWGFAYGTLDAHVEQGEERFSIEFERDGSVWYDLRAFSRPRYWPVRLASPLARRLQQRFIRESLAAMVRIGKDAAQGISPNPGRLVPNIL
jgi:uncharacterized protein (UPF0548 family)